MKLATGLSVQNAISVPDSDGNKKCVRTLPNICMKRLSVSLRSMPSPQVSARRCLIAGEDAVTGKKKSIPAPSGKDAGRSF